MNSVYNKVYILAPYNHHTGGVELAHQLIHKLRQFGQESYVVYVNDGQISSDQTITPEYTQYNIRTTDTIEDNETNILILPEIYFDFIPLFNKINIGCWWMSVDNRYKYANLFDVLRSNVLLWRKLSAIKHFSKSLKKISDKDIAKRGDRITHFYQSIYAMHHLYKCGFKKVLPLGDYINSDLLESSDYKCQRENIVLYNPAKGYNFTKKIIDLNPGIDFIPIKGYNRTELLNLMRKSKVYIDFGNFPGKDRLSREAVVNGNIVITGNLGASAYYEDVPIDSKYKFHVSNKSIKSISSMIKSSLFNYNEIKKDFDFYRKRVRHEESDFENQIKNFFFL